ncbi:IS1 family transposase, partial [Escherichia coli]|uniref:IS1 family transposase n=1 Tax=Escherichia coli TaxID=562 RepID=UPI0031409332
MASVSISCPSCSATDGVVRNGKSTAGHQRYLCSHRTKTWASWNAVEDSRAP